MGRSRVGSDMDVLAGVLAADGLRWMLLAAVDC